jgi:hypothetical protein
MTLLAFTVEGEVTMIGKSLYGPKGAQRIEIDCKGFGVENVGLYISFKGESPYALGDKITLTIEPTTINTEEQKEESDAHN